jgi:hypothetical protein
LKSENCLILFLLDRINRIDWIFFLAFRLPAIVRLRRTQARRAGMESQKFQSPLANETIVAIKLKFMA